MPIKCTQNIYFYRYTDRRKKKWALNTKSANFVKNAAHLLAVILSNFLCVEIEDRSENFNFVFGRLKIQMPTTLWVT